MLVAVAGGNLQGVEVAYLARKAGWEVLVLDRRADAPASGLCDRFVQLDLRRETALRALLNGVDLLIPALENDAGLAALERCARRAGIPLAFDMQAYAISSSKIKSDNLFASSGIPAPAAWPDCTLPVIVKPSRASGSSGVRIFSDHEALDAFLGGTEGEWVAQAFVDGPTHSLEVAGGPGNYRAFQITDLFMDDIFDCRAVSAPSRLPADMASRFQALSLDIARLVGLRGLMDIEVVQDHGELRVLEIDARFPSQTPTAVYHSTGCNLLEALAALFLDDTVSGELPGGDHRGVVYEHIRVSGNTLAFAGEHVMTHAGPLHVEKGFYGADEALTNRRTGGDNWVATLIVTGKNRRKAVERRNCVLAAIRHSLGLTGRSAPI
ncbi:MAG: 3-methylornithine--L-lysine ligase PylC [Deltaproteobacteria bacterium]|nr:3-methylornithine--L-lysine ligase PylC [Deltaproteobacteria bacterium]